MNCCWSECPRRALYYASAFRGGRLILPICLDHAEMYCAGFKKREVQVTPMPLPRESRQH
jgi:hypothetical protein